MKKIAVLLVFIVFFFGSLAAQVNGQLVNLGDRSILHVWGSHYERGYALGYLMGDNIMTIFSNYFFALVTHNSVGIYNNFLNYHTQNFVNDARYVSEAQGVIAGMQDSGTSLFHVPLQRELDVEDMLLVNAIVDLAYLQNPPDLELGCSSLWSRTTAWESTTTS